MCTARGLSLAFTPMPGKKPFVRFTQVHKNQMIFEWNDSSQLISPVCRSALGHTLAARRCRDHSDMKNKTRKRLPHGCVSWWPLKLRKVYSIILTVVLAWTGIFRVQGVDYLKYDNCENTGTSPKERSDCKLSGPTLSNLCRSAGSKSLSILNFWCCFFFMLSE